MTPTYVRFGYTTDATDNYLEGIVALYGNGTGIAWLDWAGNRGVNLRTFTDDAPASALVQGF